MSGHAVRPDRRRGARIQAAGRALADMRLWRSGRELTDLIPEQRRIGPQSGHPLADLLLFARPAIRGTLRLDLPAPAPATLTVGATTAEIVQNSGGAAAQPYMLRMIAFTGTNQIRLPGTWFTTAVTSGLGGDEPSPGVLNSIIASLLAETEADRPKLGGSVGQLCDRTVQTAGMR